ncbi:hypothetical protein HBA91_05855 [Ochrobactrum sp. MR34]|nr:hypothetical protein [Ochrobactrum sp. MR34]
MFAPSGYISVHKLIYGRLGVKWRDILKRGAIERQERTNGNLQEAMRSIACYSPVDLCEMLILRSIRDDLFIASPSGMVFNFYPPCEANSDSIAQPISPIIYCSGTPLSDYDEALIEGVWSAEKKSFNAIRDRLTKAYLEKRETDQAEFKRFLTGLGAGFSGVPMWYSRTGYFVSTKGAQCVRNIAPAFLSRAAPIIKELEPFEGWSLCVREDLVIDQEMQNYIDGKAIPEITEAEGNKTGRPSHLRDAIAEIYANSPHIFENRQSWAKTMRWLEKEYGLKASKETIKRAIEQSPK